MTCELHTSAAVTDWGRERARLLILKSMAGGSTKPPNSEEKETSAPPPCRADVIEPEAVGTRSPLHESWWKRSELVKPI